MARVVADDEQNAAPFNELAFVADFLNAGTDFHDTLSRRGAIQSIAVYEESARFHKGLEHDFRHSQTTYNHRTFYLNFHFGDLKAESIELGRPRQPRRRSASRSLRSGSRHIRPGGEQIRPVLRDCDRVLEVGTRLPVVRDLSPMVGHRLHSLRAGVDHRLDGDH